MPFQIVHQDITKVQCDAIVNPTDKVYSGSGGTDLSVHNAAGMKLRFACDQLPELQCGAVAVTDGYQMPCRYIIHTVGPFWRGGNRNEAALLRSCYLNALLKAKRLNAKSIAFPLISSGTFCFPKDQVLRIALDAIADFLSAIDTDMDVFLCVFDRQSYTLSRQIELDSFLCGIVKPEICSVKQKMCKESLPVCTAPTFYDSDALTDWIAHRDDSFAVTLLKLIDQKGLTDVECYKKANISKKTFWKINNDPKYKPSKPTVLAFAIALELSLEETEQLLKTVGFSLSHSNTFDIIIEFYITRGNYDIYEVNAALYKYDQLCLGC